MTYAIDISKHQATYNAATAKANGIDNVILRAGYSTTKDTCFDTFYAAAVAAGQHVGAYGFATWHYTSKNGGDIDAARVCMQAQTNAWIDTCKGKLDLFFAIDQELESGYTMGLSAAQNEILLSESIAMLEAAGFAVCVYCSASWAMTHFNKDNVNAPLWLAYYYADPSDPDCGGEADYTAKSGTYWSFMQSCGEQLIGWQFGRIGYGAKYGVGSDNVDKNCLYLTTSDDEDEGEDIAGRALVVEGDNAKSCEYFSAKDVDAAVGKLAIGGVYALTYVCAQEEFVGDLSGKWVRFVYDDGGEYWCWALSDRAVLKVVEEAEDASESPDSAQEESAVPDAADTAETPDSAPEDADSVPEGEEGAQGDAEDALGDSTDDSVGNTLDGAQGDAADTAETPSEDVEEGEEATTPESETASLVLSLLTKLFNWLADLIRAKL